MSLRAQANARKWFNTAVATMNHINSCETAADAYEVMNRYVAGATVAFIRQMALSHHPLKTDIIVDAFWYAIGSRADAATCVVELRNTNRVWDVQTNARAVDALLCGLCANNTLMTCGVHIPVVMQRMQNLTAGVAARVMVESLAVRIIRDIGGDCAPMQAVADWHRYDAVVYDGVLREMVKYVTECMASRANTQAMHAYTLICEWLTREINAVTQVVRAGNEVMIQQICAWESDQVYA